MPTGPFAFVSLTTPALLPDSGAAWNLPKPLSGSGVSFPLTPALSLRERAGVRGKETPEPERGLGRFHAAPESGSKAGVVRLTKAKGPVGIGLFQGCRGSRDSFGSWPQV